MAQAAFSHSIALVAPHRWMIDPDLRRLIDWERTMIMELADSYFDFSPAEMRKCLAHRLAELDYVLDRLPSGADFETIAEVRQRVIALGGGLGRITPDQLADRLMVVAQLLVTGSSYSDGDCPAEFM